MFRLVIHLFLMILTGQVFAAGAVLERSPNFIIIFTDDQGYQDVGCFGSPDISTPNLDRMADEGMRFTDFYVAAPLCTPSRAGLLTGKYPKRFGLAQGVLFPHSGNGLPPQEITIAEHLKQKGYATACVGKWHLGHHEQFLPMAQGFDSYYGIPYSNDMWLAPELPAAADLLLRDGITREQMDAMRSKKKVKKHVNLVPLLRGNEMVEFPADQATLTRRYAEETVTFIEQNKDHPFFIYMTPAMPHIPLFASADFRGKSKAGLYGDTIEEIDWAVGQIFQILKKNGLAENTLVVFASDNGPWLGYGEHGGRALPLRNGKGTCFEGGQRVPCIMKMPGIIPAGTICSEPASTLDLLPTFGKMAGLPVAHSVDGKDIRGLLDGSLEKSPHEFILYYPGGQPAAIRMGDWKLIFRVPGGKYWLSGGGTTYSEKEFQPELYNLREDIGETRNVYAEHPEISKKLLRRARAEAAEIEKGVR